MRGLRPTSRALAACRSRFGSSCSSHTRIRWAAVMKSATYVQPFAGHGKGSVRTQNQPSRPDESSSFQSSWSSVWVVLSWNTIEPLSTRTGCHNHPMTANYERPFRDRPEVYEAWAQLNKSIKHGMDLRRYELVTLAAARRLRSSYCCLAHGKALMEKFD